MEGHVFLSGSFLKNIYSKAMAKNLRTLLWRHKEQFSHDTRLDWSALFGNPHQTLYEFDSLVTRVLGGFKSTEAYYRYASSNQYASSIAVPLLSIGAEDDPIIDPATVPYSLAEKNPYLVFATTKHGGHLGFFEGLFRPRRWVGKPIVEFLREVEKADSVPKRHARTAPEQRQGKTPSIGDEMVLVEGREEIGFKEVETVRVVMEEGKGLVQGL